MVEFIGLIKVNVVRGTNLAVRDVVTSDPYVILSLGSQVNANSFLSFVIVCISATKLLKFIQICSILTGNYCHPKELGPMVYLELSSLSYHLWVTHGIKILILNPALNFFWLQSVKTRVIKNNLNPVWNEKLMLSIPENVPPLKVVCVFLSFNFISY